MAIATGIFTHTGDCITVVLMNRTLKVVAIIHHMKWKIPTLFKDDLAIYITLPLLLLVSPFVMKILLITKWQIIVLLSMYFGFFYLESLMVFIVILLYIWKAKEKIFNIALILDFIVFFLFLLFIIHYWEFQINFLITGDETKYIQEQAELGTFWYALYEKVAFDSRVHGYLGIIMGLICSYITLLGYSSNLKKDIIDDMKTILPTITLLSVIVSVTIFGLQNKEFFFSTRYIFSVGMLLFIPLVYTFGCISSISSQKRKTKSYLVLLISLLISFCIGFIYGDLMIALTRRPIPGTQVFVSFPNSYTLLCFSSLLIGMILYLLSNPKSELSRSIKKFSEILQGGM